MNTHNTKSEQISGSNATCSYLDSCLGWLRLDCCCHMSVHWNIDVTNLAKAANSL